MNAKHRIWNFGFGLMVLLLGLLAPMVQADFSIPWYTVDGGGGTSTNSQFTLTGTIGQPDAGGPMTGGDYSLSGGFWSLYAVQTTGAPWLTITRSNAMVVVWWPPPAAGWQLECTNVLTSGTNAWPLISPPYSTNATQVFYIEPAPMGSKFYRLRKP